MNRTIAMSLIMCIALLMLTGCQKSVADADAGLIQRARLVGAENLKLKKEIEEKDARIAQLEKQIEEINAQHAQAIQESGEANFKLVQILAESEKTNEQLRQEVQTLTEKLGN